MKSRVTVKFDEEKDLKNIWDACNSKSSYGYSWKKSISKNILNICEKKEYKECKEELADTMKMVHNSPLIKLTTKTLTDGWSKISTEYFRRLEKITKRRFIIKKIDAYLTTAGRCPYSPNKNPPYFYINFFSNIPNALHTMGHELMHIHLHNTDWWKKVEGEIGDSKTHDLKEAFTELLNLEFTDLWIVRETSYPNHKMLREYISKQWKKKKDFDKLTNSCIKWIKKNGVK